METFSRVIFNLLALRQRVILPGIGTLYTEQLPAASDPATGMVSVPQTRVVFSAVEQSGETLPEIIACRSGIPLKDIKPQYNRWMSKIRGASIHGELTIDGVVLLLCQPDGSFWAEPAKELDFLLNPIEPEKIRIPVLPSSKTQPKAAASSAGKPARPKKKTNPGRRATGLAIGGVVLAVLVYGSYYAYTRGFFTQDSSRPIPVHEQFRPAETVPPTVLRDTLSADTLPAVPSPAETIPPVQPPEASGGSQSGDVYHVIAGVFSNRENAERYVRENNFEPSRVTLIPTTGDRFMVSVGRYAEKSEADREMERLRSSIPQVWVSKRKK